ncbi:MAG: hypothetical protein WDZ35_09565 [Crocinitomicaceae bacterium]
MLGFLKRLKFPALTFLISALVLFYYFHEVLLHPNDYLFAPGGDGIKNYYSYLFHAKHDASFWHFGGMNYPYYEHIVYTDAHPLLSWLIGQLGLASVGIGILNVLMLLSYPICSVFLFLIFRHYKVTHLWAIAAAVAITYMAPQLGRLTGHFALSYVFAIPMMWWILIQCRQGRPALWSVISFLYIMAFFFTHPYLGVILALFCAVYWLVVYAYNRGEWKNAVGFTTIQLITPFLLFRILVFTTDTHVDRIDTPGGFYNLFGAWSSVIAAPYGPLNEFVNWIGVRMKSWETWSYVGAATLLFFLISLVYSFVKRKTLPLRLLFRHELFQFFIAAYLLLIFSFCFPFKFEWFRWIPDYIGPLKQFRVLGRFSWIFFYVVTTASIVAFYHIYRREGKRFGFSLVFFVGIAFYFVESNKVLTDVANVISQHKNTFQKEQLENPLKETIAHIDTAKYDAFILLPFTHMSSENMMLLGEEKANFDAFMISYHTGLPMLNAVSSRQSQQEAIKFNNLFGPEFVEKELLDDLPKDAKIALIINDAYLKDTELPMVYAHHNKLQFENDRFTVFTFDRDTWNTDFYFHQVKELHEKAVYEVGEDWKSTVADPWFIYESWDDKRSESLKGKGSFERIKMDYDEVYSLATEDLEEGNYTVSFWFNYYVDRADLMCFAEAQYRGDKKSEWLDTYDIKQSTHIVGHWMFCELNFTITKEMKIIKIIMAGNRSREPYILDELLIRKSDGAPLFSSGKIGGDEYLIYNNYWIKKNSFSEEDR